MKDLAPDIVRQRLLIEGLYTRDVVEADVRQYLQGLANHLELRAYGEAIVHSPGGSGKEANQGYDAFLPLIDSGISVYVWTQKKFLAVVLFTCKAFDADAAFAFTEDFFNMTEIETKSF